MKKSITFVELLIGIVIMGVIILAVAAFDIGGRRLFHSSETKVEVLNDLTFVLEHISKNVLRADNISWVPSTLTVDVIPDHRDWTISRTLTYTFNNAAHTIIFNGGSGNEILTSRLMSHNIAASEGEVSINSLVFRYKPAQAMNNAKNPEVSVIGQFFYSLCRPAD